MNKDIKGICLALGFIGLAYAAFLIAVMALTGVKIYKSIVFIMLLSGALVSLGLTRQVKYRLVDYVRSYRF